MNPFRKHGSSGGRVGYGKDSEGPGDKSSGPEESAEKKSGLRPMKKIPAAGATRQVPLPIPPKGGSPMQSPPINKVGSKVGKY